MRNGLILIVFTMLLICSCIQQENTVKRADIVLLKYKTNVDDLSVGEKFYKALERSAKQNHKILTYEDLDVNFDFKTEIQKQIKDYSRKYIIVNTLIPLDKMELLAKQNPNVFFILMDCDKDFQLANVKSIKFDRSEMLKSMAYVAAFWAETKEPLKPAVSFICDPTCKYASNFDAFKQGVDQYNLTEQSKVTLNRIDVNSTYNDEQIGKTIEKALKDNNTVYYLALKDNYFKYLKQIQDKGKYAIGMEFDMFYFKPEFQDITIVSGEIDYVRIAEDIIKGIDTGTLEAGLLNANTQNGLLGLSPFHNFDNSISQKIKTEIAFK